MERLVNHATHNLAGMTFEWDEAKDAANREKHGLSLADAARLDWAVGVNVVDARHAYGEIRIARIAFLDGRLHVCVFTDREGRIRIISLRKANQREIRDHGAPQVQTTDRQRR
jgi:uncharacterized protein